MFFRLWLAAAAACQLAAGAAAAQDNRPEVIRLGQSAAFSGPANELGKEMSLGIEAAVFEANAKRSVPGVRFLLVYYDDGYEPDRAIQNTRRLIHDNNVFALIGEVGTPTSRAAAPIALEAGVPFIAPFTGAAFLRDAEKLPNVVNFRASYRQEVDEMIDRLLEEKLINRIGILYQNDSFGKSGFENAKASLARYGLEPVASGTYERNTTAVKTAVFDLYLAQPEAVIIIGAYKPAAAAIRWSREIGFKPVFFNISFVGSQALERELGPGDYNVYMTQVVPDFRSETLEIAKNYRSALEGVWPGAKPNHVSFEGYAAARMLMAAVKRCSPLVKRACVLEQFARNDPFDIGGLRLVFGPGDNQGSDEVYLTFLHPDGEFIPIRSMNEDIDP